MTYLDDIASEIKDAVPARIDVPDGAGELFVLYALLVRACGVRTTARDVHDAWCVWMSGRDPSHTSLVPYEELAPEVQAEDLPFVEAIHAVAVRRTAG